MLREREREDEERRLPLLLRDDEPLFPREEEERRFVAELPERPLRFVRLDDEPPSLRPAERDVELLRRDEDERPFEERPFDERPFEERLPEERPPEERLEEERLSSSLDERLRPPERDELRDE